MATLQVFCSFLVNFFFIGFSGLFLFIQISCVFKGICKFLLGGGGVKKVLNVERFVYMYFVTFYKFKNLGWGWNLVANPLGTALVVSMFKCINDIYLLNHNGIEKVHFFKKAQ